MEKRQVAIRVHRPSGREKLFFFLAGVITSVPLTIFVELYLGSLLTGLSVFASTVISSVIFAPFVEEFSKAYPLFYRHGETERSIVNLAVYVGLGFGVVEFFEYVFLLNVPVVDRIPGVFFHAASTAITAYGIANRKTVRYYLLAVGLHLTNNLLAIVSPLDFSALITVITVFIAYWLYGKTQERVIKDDYAEVTEFQST